MNKISVIVIIDNSGSMACMSKNDILETVCRSIYLQENFDADFYVWNESVVKIDYENDELVGEPSGNSNFKALIDFVKENVAQNILLLTDGFIDEDTNEFHLLHNALKENSKTKVRLIGIGADWNPALSKKLFPPSFIAEKKEKYIYSVLELEEALASFSE